MAKPTFSRNDFISKIVENLSKDFKDEKNPAYILNSDEAISKIEHWVSCGSLIGDLAISGSIKGDKPIIPFGRITEIAGLNSSGKTTMLAHIIANVQKMGGIAVVADTEEVLDEKYITRIGVDTSGVLRITAFYLEDVFAKFKSALMYIKKYGPDTPVLLALDSLGSTSTKAEYEGSEEAMHYMGPAKIIAQNLRKIAPLIAQTRTALVMTNHMYTKIDKLGGGRTMSSYVSYGGERLRYFCSLRIVMQRLKKINYSKDPDTAETLGAYVSISVIKNKSFGYLRKAKTTILGGRGFNDDYIIWETSKKMLGRKGASSYEWITPSGEAVTFSRWDKFKSDVITHPEYPSLRDKVVSSLFKERKDDGDLSSEEMDDLSSAYDNTSADDNGEQQDESEPTV